MRKYHLIASLFVLSCSACVQDNIKEQPADITVRVGASFAGAKIRAGLGDDHKDFVWNDGDAVNLFNNVNSETVELKISDGEAEWLLPSSAERIYGFYPYSADFKSGPDKVRAGIPASYTQAQAGRFDIPDYPMWASASIGSDYNVKLAFSPLVTVLAINIYKTANPVEGETIRSIKVTPLENKGFAGSQEISLKDPAPALSKGDSEALSSEVTLGTPCPVHIGELTTSDAKRTFEYQIYIPLARQTYSGLKFDIKTSEGVYSVTSPEGILFSGNAADFIVTSIDISTKRVETENVGIDGAEEVPAYSEEQTVDIIPDFSRVGYHYGETPLPNLPVAATITPTSVNEALSSGVSKDTTSYIQSVIDGVAANGGGAVLLKNGTYNIGTMLFIDHDNVVLRGESETGTVIKATGTTPRSVIFLGKSVPSTETGGNINGRKVADGTKQLEDPETGKYYTAHLLSAPTTTYSIGARTEITEEYTPSGRLWIEVQNPSLFQVGSRIAIYRPATLLWIQDIYMDRIADKPGTVQWSSHVSDFDEYYYRKVTAVKGSRIYIDAPLVMGLDRKYGASYACRYTVSQISESGIENLTIDSEYDPTPLYHTYYWEQDVPADERHAWYGIHVAQSEHCWIRNVTTKHLAMSHTRVNSGRYLTVKDCTSLEPVSVASGGRRYAFYVLGGQMVLFTGCKCEKDRHACVTSGSQGPIVYHNCRCTTNFSDLGPHQHWSTGVLYDNVYTDGWLYVRDRGPSGDGHGWAGANHVFWNCTVEYGGSPASRSAGRLICQSPWASAKNYCIGCYGREQSVYEERTYTGGGYSDPDEGAKYYDWCRNNIPGYDGRPMGEWYPAREKKSTGGEKVYLPDSTAEGQFDWWPEFTLKSFSNNASLYECQLEDRISRGVFLSGIK